jgi:hypothetical protein
MEFKDERSRILFLRYALPCAATLVKRGNVKGSLIRSAIADISLGRSVEGRPESFFKTALGMCERIARRKGKKFIDQDVIRTYFLFKHDRAIDRRYKLYKDFDPSGCRTYPGLTVDAGHVRTILGKKKYRTCFTPRLRKGDRVVVHRNFTVEKIDKALFARLLALKENYFNKKRDRLIQ